MGDAPNSAKKSATVDGAATWPVFELTLAFDSLVGSESSE